MGVGAAYDYRNKYPTAGKTSFRMGIQKLWDAIPSLMLLVVVIGVLIAGYFTATEASAVTVIYALILSFVYKEVKWGSGWWFLNQKDGIENQLNTLINLSLLSRFVGMLTDSRSFLSFPRYEYFRRILCNLIGNDVENGLLPGDMQLLGEMVRNISYYNAKDYFTF